MKNISAKSENLKTAHANTPNIETSPATEKLSELHRLAEIGKMSGGFIHDLSNHVSVMSLSMDRVEECLALDSKRLREHSLQTARARKCIECLVRAMKKHIHGRDIPCFFSPEKKLRELVEMFKLRTEKEDVLIELKNGSKTGGLRIFGSRLRFNQLFSNLISNAIDAVGIGAISEKSEKSARKGGAIWKQRVPAGAKGHVEISIKKRGQFALIRVADSGPGIPAAIREKIFEPFFTTKRERGGLGLGLSGAKEIAERDFRGKIYLESEKRGRRGATFIVQIPF